MSLPDDLIKLLEQLKKERGAREKRLVRELIKIYEDARKSLYIRFIEATNGKDLFKLEYLEGTIIDIERQLKYYTNLSAQARTRAINEAFTMGKEISAEMLVVGLDSETASKVQSLIPAGESVPGGGRLKVSVAGGVGLVNKGMIESLVGNIPQLAGKVETDVLFKVRNELTRGAVMGESTTKIARRLFGTGLTTEGLKKPMDLRARCELIARTEIIKASSAGYIDLADNAQDVVGEEIFHAWITAGDSRVDPPCPQLAQGTQPGYESVPGMPGVYRRTNLPIPTIASHPRCRCRLVPVLRSWLRTGALNLNELRGRAA